MYVCMYGHTFSKSMNPPGKVANPARDQLNRENEYFSVRIRACEFGPTFSMLTLLLHKGLEMFLRICAKATSFFYVFGVYTCCLKKSQNENDLLSIPQLGGGGMSKRLGGIKGCKYKTFSWHLNGFPDGNNIGSTSQYTVGEKPTVILYTYINRHAGTPEKD